MGTWGQRVSCRPPGHGRAAFVPKGLYLLAASPPALLFAEEMPLCTGLGWAVWWDSSCRGDAETQGGRHPRLVLLVLLVVGLVSKLPV